MRVIATRLGLLSISLCPTVSLAGAPLDLPRVQLRLLQRLMEATSPVSAADLRKAAWRNEVVRAHTVHTHVALLKARLHELGVELTHIRGAGYVLGGAAQEIERKEPAA
jgi:DNA-binding response OmpR family regulator